MVSKRAYVTFWEQVPPEDVRIVLLHWWLTLQGVGVRIGLTIPMKLELEVGYVTEDGVWE